MIKLILKNWKLIIDILIVIAAIVAFTFWDPFGMFTKTQTRATANMVSSIKDIGQLVTAEYYGEVISSLKEVKITEIPEDTISIKAKNLFLYLKNDLHDASSLTNPENLVRETRNEYSPIYDEFIAYLGTIYLGSADITNYYNSRYKRLKYGVEQDVLKAIRNKDKQISKQIKKQYKNDNNKQSEMINKYLDEIPEKINDFFDNYLFLIKKSLTKGSEKKKNIVFIGRGSVKAGFDFGKLNERNFMYDKQRKTVHFYGLNASVLDTDINPWFIPERKVKGFELVDYSGKVTFKDAKKVKRKCKQKLLDQARKAEIISKANENGKEALTNFFSLLLDESELNVEFHNQPYDNDWAILTADSIITFTEALFIDSLYRKELRKITNLEEPNKTQQLKQLGYFIEDLKSIPFYQSEYSFSYYSIIASAILKDTFHISASDLEILNIVRDTLKLDALNENRSLSTDYVAANPLWYQNTDFRIEYNQMLHFIEDWVSSISQMKTIKIDSTTKDTSNLFLINKSNSNILGYPLYSNKSYSSDSLIRFLPFTKISENKLVLSDFRYSTLDLKQNEDSLFYRLKRNDSLFCADKSEILYFSKAKQLNKKEKGNIEIALRNKLTYQKQIAPLEKIKQFTNRIFANK